MLGTTKVTNTRSQNILWLLKVLKIHGNNAHFQILEKLHVFQNVFFGLKGKKATNSFFILT